MDEQYEEDKSFAEMFDPAQSKVQCAFAFEVAARSVQTGRSDKGCQVQSSKKKKKKSVKCTHIYKNKKIFRKNPYMYR